MSEVYDVVLIPEKEETQRINLHIRKEDWESAKEKLVSELGLAFNTAITQQEKYIVKRVSAKVH